MNTLDTLLVVVLMISAALGLYWGLIRQLLSVVGLIAGIVLATRYSERVADALSSFISNAMATQVLGFLFVLIAVSAAASLLATILRRSVGLLFLGWADHMLGGLLGLVQGALACTVILMIVALAPSDRFASALTDSRIVPLLARVAGFALLPFLPDSFHAAAQRLISGL
jgi:membrane protein required for colicin V production